jgi:hypothetical protein
MRIIPKYISSTLDAKFENVQMSMLGCPLYESVSNRCPRQFDVRANPSLQ